MVAQELNFFVRYKSFLSKGAYVLREIHSHSYLILDPESAFYDHFRGGEAPSDVIVVCRSRIHDQMAVSVAVTVDRALRLRTFVQMFPT